MRILINSYDLSRRGGSQSYVCDLARKLQDFGHVPVVHSPTIGLIGASLRPRNIEVTSDLASVSAPDVIVGNYHLLTIAALQQFREVPAVFICHGVVMAPKFPRIRRHLAIDRTTAVHLEEQCGIDPGGIETIFNAVDLTRFPRRPPLPARPRRALMLGNEFVDNKQQRAVRTACEQLGIETDVVGIGFRNEVAEPGEVLPQYDLVFARARSALEAMATGAAVILTGPTRTGGLVTAANVHHFRGLNFGRTTLTTPITVDAVRGEIEKYDPDDAAKVSTVIRESASLDNAAGHILRVLQEVVEEQRKSAPDIDGEYAATAAYLRALDIDSTRRVQQLRLRVERWPVIGRLVSRMTAWVVRSLTN